MLKDPYYLETQHLLIAVKGEDQQESYGMNNCLYAQNIASFIVRILSETLQTTKLTILNISFEVLKMLIKRLTVVNSNYKSPILFFLVAL